MEEIIVTIIGRSYPKMSGTRFFDEEDNVEYIELKGNGISHALFKNINQGTSVEVFSQNKSLGFYALITATVDMVVLAKGDIPKLLKRINKF